MKTFTKFLGIIAIMAVIASGLSACFAFTPAPPPDEETLALRSAMQNATWEKKALDNQPSLSGLEKLSSGSEEVSFFQRAGTSDANSDGREIGISSNGVKSTIKLIYMAPNTWYELTASEIPGITYYYFLQGGGAVSLINVYKGRQ
jgi:hypothetical protein